MKFINGKLVLYHGSKSYFDAFDFSKAKPYKDFGRGFYLTSDVVQAIERSTSMPGDCYLYSYGINIPDDISLRILEITEYDKRWLDYIALNRTHDITDPDFDIVYDKIADSRYKNIKSIIKKYTRGEINVDSALQDLMWRDPTGDQYCFKTERSVSCLVLLRCVQFDANNIMNRKTIYERKDDSDE